jgi:hypothetical protein
MARSRFSFVAEVWEHEGPAAWHFVSLPEAMADEIEATYGHLAGGFGSLRVEVTVGKTRWSTSVFPDRKRGTYVLPVKRSVRVTEQLLAGGPATVSLVVIEK